MNLKSAIQAVESLLDEFSCDDTTDLQGRSPNIWCPEKVWEPTELICSADSLNLQAKNSNVQEFYLYENLLKEYRQAVVRILYLLTGSNDNVLLKPFLITLSEKLKEVVFSKIGPKKPK